MTIRLLTTRLKRPLTLAYVLLFVLLAGFAPLVLAQTVIDILVVYTPQARDAVGGSAGILSRIDAAMAQANQSLANSSAQATLRLVHAAEVEYTETGDMSTELERLVNSSDGHMDNVHTLRNRHGADLVALLTGRQDTGGVAGIAYLMNPPGSGFAPYAFSVTRQDQALFHTFIHEIGHNMGCHHDPDNKGGIDGAYDYSFGHRFWAGGTQYRTVMAYAPGTRISYFSNPSISYNGTATGIANERDNARTIRNTRAIVADFRAAVTESFWFRAVALDDRVMLRWQDPQAVGYESDVVHIRGSNTDYPAGLSDGTPVYEGSDRGFLHAAGITSGQSHYYTIWLSDDGETFVEPD